MKVAHISLLIAVASSAFTVVPAEMSAPEFSPVPLSETDESLGDYSADGLSPLQLTAKDFVTKVYGVVDTTLPESEVIREMESRFCLTPAADSDGLWLGSADGYAVSYYGMTPDVTAMVRFVDGYLSNYTYFFLFPYASGARHEADARQCEFCGSLLQEMKDLGMDMGSPVVTDAVFEAIGSYEGHYVNIRLFEECRDDLSGRFIVLMDVEPKAFFPEDELIASD